MKTNQEKIQFKTAVKSTCTAMLNQRIKNAEAAIAASQESANNESKSSAGDKHETARAMSQLDTEVNTKQVEQAKAELKQLTSIDVTTCYTMASTGSVIVCNDFIFFIAIGLGALIVDDKKVFALSPNAPIAALLHQKKQGDSFLFNGKTVFIEDVF